MKRWLVAAVALSVIVAALPAARTAAEEKLVCNNEVSQCPLAQTTGFIQWLQKMPTPELQGPKPPEQPKPILKTVTYSVATRGNITADIATFKIQANQTLNDNRGWYRLGVNFKEVSSGGDFTLYLSEADQVPSFSSICDNFYSCAVGRNVIINQDRWEGATPPWNQSGGSLRDYRHMVVNHEVGHWLGHGHGHCSAPGALAAVMQQQSYNLAGCKFNPWPLDSELHASRLGL